MTDLTEAKNIIDENIAQHSTDEEAVIRAAHARPAERRTGFIGEALDEAQRSQS